MEDFLKELNESQYKAVISNHNKILCLAGAGAGKTKVLTTRASYLNYKGVSFDSMLCLTFTRLAGYEMKTRVINLVGEEGKNLYCNTFHAFCVTVFKKFGKLIGLDDRFIIYDQTEREQTILKIIDELRLSRVNTKVIEGLIDGTIKPSIKLSHESRVADEYKFRLKRNNATDLNLLLVDTVNLFKDYPEVQEYYHEKYQYVFVDEFQDTNDIQMEFITLLNPENLFLVGDDFQNIYSWRGARVEYIINYASNPDFEVIKITKNYRSTEEILNAANNLIAYNEHQIPKTLVTDKKGDKVELAEVKTVHDEAMFVGEKIMQLDKDYKDFAILSRTNKQLEVFEKIFKEFGIPYQIVSGQEDIFSHPEIKMIISYIYAAQNVYDEVNIKRLINLPIERLSEKELNEVELEALEKDISFYEALLDNSTPAVKEMIQLLDRIKDENIFPLNASEAFSKIRSLMYKILIDTDVSAFVDFNMKIKEWEKVQSELEGDASMQTFLAWLKTRDIEAVDIKEKNEVKLMTVHASKGLEFDTVFIIGMNEKIFPSKRSDNIEEERRLFYVAITRAKNKLFILRPMEVQNPFTLRIEKYDRSQFIREANL